MAGVIYHAPTPPTASHPSLLSSDESEDQTRGTDSDENPETRGGRGIAKDKDEPGAKHHRRKRHNSHSHRGPKTKSETKSPSTTPSKSKPGSAAGSFFRSMFSGSSQPMTQRIRPTKASNRRTFEPQPDNTDQGTSDHEHESPSTHHQSHRASVTSSTPSSPETLTKKKQTHSRNLSSSSARATEWTRPLSSPRTSSISIPNSPTSNDRSSHTRTGTHTRTSSGDFTHGLALLLLPKKAQEIERRRLHKNRRTRGRAAQEDKAEGAVHDDDDGEQNGDDHV